MGRLEFTNVFKGNVLDNIHKIIKQALPNIPLYYDENRGQQSFLIRPISDTFVDYASNSQIREYTTEIVFEVRTGAEFTRDKDIQRLTDIAEIVKRTFFDNRDLAVSNATKWYNGQVASVSYERDTDDEEIERVVIIFECNVNEVVS